ncbi:hypothetical protein C2845_PM03G03950 [Panicum miliaceum]|uniref:Uncharacterized protein n=1 Tax=Panicum miliaceum TaxID=4540 RepID=A0A3L6T3Y7_PANMI|nr:hypothetical protein C2845_PM03G03950 [Panicum miliaceum]
MSSRSRLHLLHLPKQLNHRLPSYRIPSSKVKQLLDRTLKLGSIHLSYAQPNQAKKARKKFQKLKLQTHTRSSSKCLSTLFSRHRTSTTCPSLTASSVDDDRGHTAHGGAASKKAAGVHVPLLAGGVPDLRLDALAVEREGARLELHPDGGLGVERELVPREARQQLRLPHRRVPHHHHLEHVVDLRLALPPRLLLRLRLSFLPPRHHLFTSPPPRPHLLVLAAETRSSDPLGALICRAPLLGQVLATDHAVPCCERRPAAVPDRREETARRAWRGAGSARLCRLLVWHARGGERGRGRGSTFEVEFCWSAARVPSATACALMFRARPRVALSARRAAAQRAGRQPSSCGRGVRGGGHGAPLSRSSFYLVWL